MDARIFALILPNFGFAAVHVTDIRIRHPKKNTDGHGRIRWHKKSTDGNGLQNGIPWPSLMCYSCSFEG